MAIGLSLHVGLNEVDQRHYGSKISLEGCRNDANDMTAIARAGGYEPTTLLDSEGTAARVAGALDAAASRLRDGDYFLLTYAGHGSQVMDKSKDEADRRDETWVLYDRLFIDDEIHAALAQFEPGVRILVISDSCHSGTVALESETLVKLPSVSIVGSLDSPSGRGTVFRTPRDPDFSARVMRDHRALYAKIPRSAPDKPREPIRADVIQISACQDRQLAADGKDNGHFTSQLKVAWSSGAFQGSHHAFWQAITEKMPPTQTPNYLIFGGAGVIGFERTRPFSIREGKGTLSPAT